MIERRRPLRTPAELVRFRGGAGVWAGPHASVDGVPGRWSPPSVRRFRVHGESDEVTRSSYTRRRVPHEW